MHDASREDRLFAVADEQLGHFTAKQARACGYTSSMLAHHVARGRFLRLGWGVYRFTRYPHSPHQEIVAAWLTVGPDAVVSHETALHLYGLSDVIPDSIHLTLPRHRRYVRTPPGVTLHTRIVPIGIDERSTHAQTGVPVTTPIRTIIDVAAAGAPQEEIVKAVSDALASRRATADDLRGAAVARGGEVLDLVQLALREADDARATLRGAG
jgi:predicted transcriptional regulator of viral defense system